MSDVFMKKLTRAATELFGSRLFWRDRIRLSEGEIVNFSSVYLYQEAIDNANFGFYSIRHQKLKKKPTYQSISGCVEPKAR